MSVVQSLFVALGSCRVRKELTRKLLPRWRYLASFWIHQNHLIWQMIKIRIILDMIENGIDFIVLQ